MIFLLAATAIVAQKPFLIKMNTENLAMIATFSPNKVRMSKRADIDMKNLRTIPFIEESGEYVYINFCGQYVVSKVTDPGIILGEKGDLGKWLMVNAPGGGFRFEQRGMCLVMMDTTDVDGYYMNLQPCNSRWMNVFEKLPLGDLPYAAVCGGLEGACRAAGFTLNPRVLPIDRSGGPLCHIDDIYGSNRVSPDNTVYDKYGNPIGTLPGYDPLSPYASGSPGGRLYSTAPINDPEYQNKRRLAGYESPSGIPYDPNDYSGPNLSSDGQVIGSIVNGVYKGLPHTHDSRTLGDRGITEAGHYIQYNGQKLVTYPDKLGSAHSVDAVTKGI